MPLTTTELSASVIGDRQMDQFGSSAFFGSRNIEPTLVACSFDE